MFSNFLSLSKSNFEILIHDSKLICHFPNQRKKGYNKGAEEKGMVLSKDIIQNQSIKGKRVRRWGAY